MENLDRQELKIQALKEENIQLLDRVTNLRVELTLTNADYITKLEELQTKLDEALHKLENMSVPKKQAQTK